MSALTVRSKRQEAKPAASIRFSAIIVASPPKTTSVGRKEASTKEAAGSLETIVLEGTPLLLLRTNKKYNLYVRM